MSVEMAWPLPPTLIEASAGTGKTYEITTFFVRAIVEGGLDPASILVVTYTKAATSELRVRARQRVSNALARLEGASTDDEVIDALLDGAQRAESRDRLRARLHEALLQMDQAPILTIHGFCQRLLQEYPLVFGIDFDFTIVEDARPRLLELATDYWLTELHDKPEWFVSALRDKRKNPAHLAHLARTANAPHIEMIGPEECWPDDGAFERFRQRFADAARIWNEERDAIVEILLEAGLNRTQYKLSTIADRWVPQLDALFERPSTSLPGWFERLGRRRMKVNKGFERPSHRFFEACDRLLDAQADLSPCIDYAIFRFEADFVARARAASYARCQREAALTYDDLLSCVHQRLTEDVAASIRRDYPVALVDEFQDTDSLQYDIFRSIYGNRGAVYVGDPKQAIYAFRGADVFTYFTAASDVGRRHRELTVNRRSEPNLVAAVHALFTNHPTPFALEQLHLPKVSAHYESRSSFDPSIEVILLDEGFTGLRPEDVVPELVAREVALTLTDGARVKERDGGRVKERALRPSDVAVLCRKNEQARLVTEALRALGVPASLDGDSSVLDTDLAEEIQVLLEAALMPGDSLAIRRALITRLVGVSPRDLGAMDEELWAEWMARFRAWREIWHLEGVVRFLEELLRTCETEQRLARFSSARRALTDLAHVQELLMRGERECHRDPVALVMWYRRLRTKSAESTTVAAEELQQRPDSDADAVRVTTIHKSKGLEYGIVYCPFPWGDAELFQLERKVVRFHDPNDGHRLKIDLGSKRLEEHLALSEREHLSEALRLLYVAVTRAKFRCTLFWGPLGKSKRSALSYLLHGRSKEPKDDDVIRADLDAVATASKGTIGWRQTRTEPVVDSTHSAASVDLAALPALRRFRQAPRIASFTSLTGHHEKTAPRDPEREPMVAEPLLFSSLPGGARTGLLLHAILEHVDHRSLDAPDASKTVTQQLIAFGYDEALAPSIVADLKRVVDTPWSEERHAPRLCEVPRAAQLRELEFTLGVASPSFSDLASIMEAHGAPACLPDYPAQLCSGSTGQLERFLRGFIDVLFEWRGRWYLADYKSNSLTSYSKESTAAAAARAHYLLQTQLYAAAAHRHLEQRLPGYDPEKHWGGTALLFLRGMRGSDQPGAAVLFERQSPALLKDVDDWLGALR